MPRKNKPTDVFRLIDMKRGNILPCWPWEGTVNKKDGRPYFTIDNKRRPAYAIVLELATGQKQEKGKIALHSCDNPICCNPDHLRWGSHQENMDDMKERERHGLPRIVVRAIHSLLEHGRKHSDIAELYGISREAVTAIHNRQARRGTKG